MLHFPYRSFNGSPVVLTFLLTLSRLAPSLATDIWEALKVKRQVGRFFPGLAK
jgi:hypothetical protein